MSVPFVGANASGQIFARGDGSRGLFVRNHVDSAWVLHPSPVGAQDEDPIDFQVVRSGSDIWEIGCWFDYDVGGGYHAHWNGQYWWMGMSLNFWEYVTALAVHQPDDRIQYLWLATECYRTDDGGDSTTLVSQSVRAVRAVTDPADPDIVLAAQAGPDPVQLSVDGGSSWTPISVGLPAGNPTALLMAGPDHLIVAFDTDGLFQSFDRGVSWLPVPIDLAGGTITSVDRDPASGRLFVATSRAGVWISGIGFHNTGLPTRNILSIAWSPPHRTLLVGTSNAGALALGIPRAPLLQSTERPAFPARPAVHPSPNPTRSGSVIRLSVPESAGVVRLEIFDLAGRRVRVLADGVLGPGEHHLPWDGRGSGGQALAAGVYFVRAEAGAHAATARLVLVR